VTAFQPRRQAPSGFGHDLELHWSAGLLLNNRRAVADGPPTSDIADPDLHKIAAPQLAVDRQVEQRPIAQPPVLVEVESDGPDVARFERTLGADVLACIPRTPFMHGRVQV